MKFQIFSDCHLEFLSLPEAEAWIEGLPIKAPHLLIAGDFAGEHVYRLLSIAAERWKTVTFVEGNHDRWGTSAERVAARRGKIHSKLPNVKWLREEIRVIEGQRILGTSLWWSPSIAGPTNEWAIRRRLQDYKQIPNYADFVQKASDKARRFLREEMREGDVVLTHHAPSWQSQPDERRLCSSPLDYAYYNDLDDLIHERKPALLVHGHTHDVVDYTIGESRVVSFPIDYPDGYTVQNTSGVVTVPLGDKQANGNEEAS